MQGLKKKLNSFINASIGLSVFFSILGFLFLLFPETSIEVIRWIIVVIASLTGICLIASDFSRYASRRLFSTTSFGVAMIIIAVVFAIYKNIMDIFPIVIGAWFIINALNSIRFATTLRGTTSGVFSIVTAVLSLICGAILIFRPFFGAMSIMVLAGILMIVYGISNIIEMCILKRNLKDIANSFKKSFKLPED